MPQVSSDAPILATKLFVPNVLRLAHLKDVNEQAALRSMRAADRAKDDFIAIISHE